MRIDYFFNGNKFRDYGVIVSGSKGIIGKPPRKKPNIFEYPDESGNVPDLQYLIYDVRTIELTCTIVANSASIFIDMYNSFAAMLNVAGIQTLQIMVGSKSLSFQVYLSEISSIEKRLKEGMTYGKFTVKFIEPDTSIYE